MAVSVFLRRHAALIAVIVIVTIIALPTLTYPLGRDQGEFAVIGRGLLMGRVPYADLWNPKPPAIFYIYAGAMALFGQTVPALRAIDLLMYPLVAVGLYRLGLRLHSRRLGVWAALLFGAFYFSETFWTLTQNDGIALLPMTWAMVCAVEAAHASSRRRAIVWAFAAGLLAGWVVWFKYPFALFVLALVLTLWLIRRQGHSAFDLPWRELLALSFGGLVTTGGGVIIMMMMGAWEELVVSAQVTASYTALGLTPQAFTEALITALSYRWDYWGGLIVLAGAALISGVLRRHTSQDGMAWRQWTTIVIWLGAGLAIMLVQAKGYDYHWLPMLSPLVLLAGRGLVYLIDRAAKQSERLLWGMRAIALMAICAIPISNVWGRALPYLTGREDQTAYYRHFQAGEFIADESLLVSEYLRARVVPTDSLFIWGFRPEVYYMSQLLPATRYIFHFPLVGDWYPQEWREDNVEVLWAAMPPYVLVLKGDYLPWVTGSEDDSDTLLQSYDDLNDWLIYNYERDAQIGTFQIWRRTP